MNDPRGMFEELAQQLECDDRYGGLPQVFDNNPDQLIELLETGSVTLNMLGCKFVLTLNVKEET